MLAPIAERAKTVGVNAMSQKNNFTSAKLILIWVDEYTMFFEASEELLQVLCMFFGRSAGDEDVIDICVAEIQASCYLVDKSLGSLLHVPKFKGHPGVLE